MVGAGGIGCELLKTLVLSGFEDIEMIDLDTIDVSNLNRQFLFRKRHVGMSKAKVRPAPRSRSRVKIVSNTIRGVPTIGPDPGSLPQVARETVLKFRPDARIVAHHGNVKDSSFDVTFVRSFDVVLNGLDNLEARKHVNRLCLAASPADRVRHHRLPRAGHRARPRTDGVLRVQPQTGAQVPPDMHPAGHADKPIHCVHAADLLFPRLFSNDPNAKSDLDEEDAVELSAFTRTPGESPESFAVRVYDYVFRTKIERLLAKEEMWADEKRKKPTPLPAFTDLVPEGPTAAAHGTDVNGDDDGNNTTTSTACRAWAFATRTPRGPARMPLGVMRGRARILRDESNGNHGTDKFDKDDALAVEFVTATAALRAPTTGSSARACSKPREWW